MKRIIFTILICCLYSLFLSGCANTQKSSAATNPERIPQVNQNNSISQSTPTPSSTLLSEKDIKRREEVHKLMLEGKYAHDGALELARVGDISSVPALLVALKNNPPMKMGDRLGFICTTSHILAALRKITGHNAGNTYEEWNAWWTQFQKDKKVNAIGAA